MRNLLSNSLKVCAFVLSSLFSAEAFAQTVANSNLNCTPAQAHCTSNDLQIVSVFTDAPACASCNSGDNVAYTLKMTIHNGTKSIRTAFALYGTLSAGATITPIAGGSPISGKIFICVGPITVKSSETLPGESAPGNQTFTVGTISFSCGQSLTLSDNILAWTDAAGITADRCGDFFAATVCADVQPKCGEAGTIVIRQPLSAAATDDPSCDNAATGKMTVTPNGGKAPYDIVINGTTYNNVSSATASDLAGGTCTFSVTDDAGCSLTSTASVTTVACCVTPTKPEFTITEPTVSLCSSTTTGGSVNFCTTNSNYTYKVGNKDAVTGTGSALSVGGLAAGSSPEIVVTDTRFTGCSNTFSCSDAVGTCSTASPSRVTTTVMSESTSSGTTVKAYPNPFSDRIKFVVTSAVGGNGVLDVYNMTGQKVKTIHQGYIAAGTQTFELSLPTQQVANLVYVLRIGDKKMTGKILQINK